MNDKKLLEFAAKAAGYEVGVYEPTISSGSKHNEIMYCRDGNIVSTNWNPLTNDGDALRLALKLNMKIDIDDTKIVVNIVGRVYCDQIYSDENYKSAALRRAIVSAAAEIGKDMK